jgi:uncharacterized membrane protein
MSQEHTAAGKHPKQDFQVERLAFFSDAVFAIAITLLIIEFKVPHITKDSTYHEVWQQVLGMKYQFAALLFSFLLIATYWIRHHLLFKHIHNYNGAIVVTSMLILLPIIFFPFTTAFVAESFENPGAENAGGIIAVQLFAINNILAGIFMGYLYWLAFIRHKDFSYEMSAKDKSRFFSETLFTTVVFAIFLAFTFFKVPKNIFLLVLLILAILRRVVLRNYLKKRFVAR